MLRLTIHKDFAKVSKGRECVAAKAGVFSLCFEHDLSATGLQKWSASVIWAVRTQGSGWCNVTSSRSGFTEAVGSARLSAAGGNASVYTVSFKATYNSSSGARVFANGKELASSRCQGGGDLATSTR